MSGSRSTPSANRRTRTSTALKAKLARQAHGLAASIPKQLWQFPSRALANSSLSIYHK